MSNYEFVNVLDRANVDDYIALFIKSYGINNKLTAAYLHWLYEENPHGRAIGFDAYLDGELAAHYVTIPRIYRIGNENIPGVLSVNTATHPNHQRKGLFTRLAAATYERAEQEGYHFIVGIANAQSISGFLNKLEFQHLGQIRLALWRKPPYEPNGYALLDKGKDWMSWRLSNPSAEYFLTHGGDDESIINTRRGRVVFSIGRTKNSFLPDSMSNTLREGDCRIGSLTPVNPSKGYSPFLPKLLMPSPWHIVLRRMGARMDNISKIHFDGLSMDTF